jgi:hypothetical protein
VIRDESFFSGSSGTTFDVGLVVEDHGPAGRAWEQAFKSVPAFNLSEGIRDDLMATLKNGKLRALIVVPGGVSAAVSSGKPAQVETYYDPHQPNDGPDCADHCGQDGAGSGPRITLLAAQVAHRLAIGGVQTFLILLIGMLAFKVNIVGNLALLLAFVLLGTLMFVALGYLISGLSRTQESVTGITQLLNFPICSCRVSSSR